MQALQAQLVPSQVTQHDRNGLRRKRTPYIDAHELICPVRQNHLCDHLKDAMLLDPERAIRPGPRQGYVSLHDVRTWYVDVHPVLANMNVQTGVTTFAPLLSESKRRTHDQAHVGLELETSNISIKHANHYASLSILTHVFRQTAI